MNSLYIQAYTDEDMYGTIARALRDRGYDVISTPEAGNIGQSDQEQLQYAILQQRTLITFNVADFVQLHAEYLQADSVHWGIIVSKRLPIGEVVKRMLNLLNSLTADEMRNR
jgi:predicted nuclease of predicted toxin-antitoxin system